MGDAHVQLLHLELKVITSESLTSNRDRIALGAIADAFEGRQVTGIGRPAARLSLLGGQQWLHQARAETAV